MAKPLLDDRGCLTPAGLLAVQSAPVGKAPQELASHVASCPRCQEKLLAGGILALATRKEKKDPPPPWRIVLVLVAIVLLVLSLMFTLGRLSGA
ncbi:MAG TPA: hypothetical protein VFM88_09450 [Vicinamibacteria bacterium]|nr:hypothetical protein [Vicinamibacteria bacterium]